MSSSIWLKNGRFRLHTIVALFLLPVVTAIICLGIGRMNVPLPTVVETLLGVMRGREVDAQTYSIVMQLRLPRIIMAAITGAGLTCAGAAFQSLFSNPLATPDILGVSSGTSVGAIVAIIFSFGIIQTQLLALLFGLFTVWITLRIAGEEEDRSIVMMILAGVIVSSLLNAAASLLKYTADPMDKLPAITYWLMGSFTSSSYEKILIGTPLIICGTVVIYLLRWHLNSLSLGEDEAKASGINLKKMRLAFILASTLITASSVSMCGQIGWIGLLVPHLARMMFGSNNRYVIPLSISLGAAFMIVIDTVSRSLLVIELPISILTAIMGAPVFISLLKRTRGSRR